LLKKTISFKEGRSISPLRDHAFCLDWIESSWVKPPHTNLISERLVKFYDGILVDGGRIHDESIIFDPLQVPL
jgi:hypothetical protein